MGLSCWAVFGADCIGVWVWAVGLCLGLAVLGYGSWLLGCVWDQVCWGTGLGCWAVFGTGVVWALFFGVVFGDWLCWGLGLGCWAVFGTGCIGVRVLGIGLGV